MSDGAAPRGSRATAWLRGGSIAIALIVLVALDGIASLEGLPMLVVLLGIVLVVTERLRIWLKAHQRVGVSMLPFMSAALVLLFGFARGRDLSQGVLLLITLALVFDILLIALSLIGEASKRGAKGVGEFVGLTALGLALGGVLCIAFALGIGRPGGMGLAQP